MHIIIQRSALRRLVEAVRGSVDPKSAIKSLATILLSAESAELVATATDLYRASETSVMCDVQVPGRICLSASELEKRIKQLPDGQVEIVTQDRDAATVIRVPGKALRYSMPALPGTDFPKLPFEDHGARTAAFSAPAATVTALIESVQAGVSTDSTRPHVNSALVEWMPTAIRVISTDGHRLFMRDAANVAVGSGEFLVPLASLSEARRCLSDAAEGSTVTFSQSKSWIHMAIGEGCEAIEFSFNTPTAQFPPYEQIISGASANVPCRVNRQALLDAVSRVAVAVAEKFGGIKMVFAPSVIRVFAESVDTGSGSDEVSSVYSGAEVSVGLNARYVLDALSGIDADEVEIGVGLDELSPIIVRGGNGYVAVIMPMRV